MNIKKARFMLGKMKNDWSAPKDRFLFAEDMNSRELKEYYFVFEEKRIAAGKDQKLIKRFDENGIPINKTYIDVVDKDYVYFPISIGQMGLSVFHTWLKSGRDEDRTRFMKFADWFYEHADISGYCGSRWLTDVSLPAYHNPGPWQSAFSQSRGISILLRAYQLSGENKYAHMAEDALRAYELEVNKGGVASMTEYGPFYEEYTADVPTLVLNGMVFALWGPADFMRVFPGNVKAENIFNKGVETLKGILPAFDMGYWTRYNLCKADWYPDPDPATIGYQRLHIMQMKLMYTLTGEDFFAEYAQRFTHQDTLFNALRMYSVKYRALKMINRL